MGGFRSKIIFFLIVYFAGFATAIYCLLPVPEEQNSQQNNVFASAFKSDEFAKSFNSGLHKCIDFGSEAAAKAGTFFKENLLKRQENQ